MWQFILPFSYGLTYLSGRSGTWIQKAHLNTHQHFVPPSVGALSATFKPVILGKAKGIEVPFRAERHHCPFNIFSIWGTLSTQTLKPSEKTRCLLCQVTDPPKTMRTQNWKSSRVWKSTTLPHQYQKNVEMWNCENYFFIDAMHVSSLTIGGKLDSFCLTCFILWWGGFLEIFFGWHVGIAGIQKRHYYNLGVTDGHLGVTSRQKKTWGN